MRAKKGTVSIGVNGGWLRLVWTYQGKKTYLTLGLLDSPTNRTKAEYQALVIQKDLESNNYDPTLLKYRPELKAAKSTYTASELFSLYTQHKAKTLHPKTIEKYHNVSKHLDHILNGRLACYVGSELVDKTVDHFREAKLNPRTTREYLELITACWSWALSQGYVECNPWTDSKLNVKLVPRQKRKPFTKEEIQKIVQGFRTNFYYSHYSDMVEFMFSSGVRIGECIGLRWESVSQDCSSVWIGESYSRKTGTKSTKTGKARTVKMNERMQIILMARRVKFPDSKFVFQAPTGGAVNGNNFARRAWGTILKEAGVEYRPPYTSRHSVVSHAVDLGLNPAVIAEITGHDVRTLFKDYLSAVSAPTLPDLLD